MWQNEHLFTLRSINERSGASEHRGGGEERGTNDARQNCHNCWAGVNVAKFSLTFRSIVVILYYTLFMSIDRGADGSSIHVRELSSQ